jgi:uridine kinase
VTARSPRPVLCALVGDQPVATHRLALGIAERLGPERCTILALDDYLSPAALDGADSDLALHDPAATNLALMAQHLRLLRQGETIFKPVIDRAARRFVSPEFVYPAEVILAHGLHGLATPELRATWDASVFLESGDADGAVLPHVLPQRERADLVIVARPPGGRSARVELRFKHPVPLPALDELQESSPATVLHVSSAAAGPDVVAVDGSAEHVRIVTLRLLAAYLIERAWPRPTLSPAAARPALPVPGA